VGFHPQFVEKLKPNPFDDWIPYTRIGIDSTICCAWLATTQISYHELIFTNFSLIAGSLPQQSNHFSSNFPKQDIYGVKLVLIGAMKQFLL
jgi:hypothetical protein